VDKVGIAVWQDRKLLTVRKHGHAVLILPGGKPEPFDGSDYETLRREIEEELRCGVNSATLSWVGLFEDASADDPHERIRVHLFRGELEGDPVPSGEIAECRWFDPERDDPQILAPSIRNEILPFLCRDRR
jgi:8-oxo-dGTP diphosphatase